MSAAVSVAQATPVVKVEKIIAASPSQVFAAWTEPEQLLRWWGQTEQHEVFIAVIDLRAGGRYRLGMRAPDGQEFIVGGQYLEIIPAQKLIFDWRWEHSAEDFPTTVVTIELAAHDRGCQLQLTHEYMPDVQARQHKQGWLNILDRMTKLLSSH